ncbi:MAG: hypothetical protein DMG21_19795 [Acidobacteria bacterium]|nr:MAG: hypothetical protein DMG21_19795 [Acidobacteriota bacterium]
MPVWIGLRKDDTLRLLVAVALALAGSVRARAQTPKGSVEPALKLLLTFESSSITYPFAARATLHLVNGGTKPVWLYHRARNGVPAATAEGPTLAIHFATAASGKTESGEAAVLEPTGLPHPKLVRLGPGEEYTEKKVIRLAPAHADGEGEGASAWGRYRISAAYSAHYSNADEIARLTGVELWQGEVTGAPAEVELARPTATGSLSGSVLGSDNRRITYALVSLADGEEELVGQTEVDANGQFAFSKLPAGVYWLVVERLPRRDETAVFRRFELTADSPAQSYDFVLAPPEIYEPKQMLHEPVVFRVTNPAGHPVADASLEVTWSSGEVMDSVKARTDAEGLASVELIPGANFVSIKRKGCPEEDQRVMVEARGVVDAFSLTEECRKP